MGAEEVLVRQDGDVKMVSFHIEVDAGLSVTDAHWLAEAAEEVVETQLQWRAVAHVDPVDRSHPLFNELDDVLRAHVVADPALVDIHDLRAEGEAPPFKVSCDLVTDMETSRSQYDAICDRCLAAVSAAFAGRVGKVEIGIEASVESAPMIRRQFDLPAAGK